MASRNEIRAVFADPQEDGMDALYKAIGCSLKDGANFDRAYQLVIEASGVEAATWITFCVRSSMRFEEPPEESEFLRVLEEFTCQYVEKNS